ncbi:hypothetical protein H310_15267, partial [Aphanomyces invadans]
SNVTGGVFPRFHCTHRHGSAITRLALHVHGVEPTPLTFRLLSPLAFSTLSSLSRRASRYPRQPSTHFMTSGVAHYMPYLSSTRPCRRLRPSGSAGLAARRCIKS